VSSYNAIGMPPPDVKPKHHGLKRAESRLRERTVIDRAKAILIKQRRLSEPDTHSWLRKNAMSSARRIADVANDVIKNAEGSGG